MIGILKLNNLPTPCTNFTDFVSMHYGLKFGPVERITFSADSPCRGMDMR